MIEPMGARKLVKSVMIVVLALMLFYRPPYVHSAAVPQNSTDMLALIDFRQAITGDPRGFFNSWKNSVDYCNWNGVTCSKTHLGRVRELNITGQSLEGRISPSLGNLTLLKTLDLSSNSLSGQLPDLNRLRKLQKLLLKFNNLQGLAPNALKNCSSLQTLDIRGNMLAGSIPSELGFLYNLVVLHLESNSFTGVIPSSLGNITQLMYLFLHKNQLEGHIPTELGQSAKLIQLALGENRLSGSIPTTLLNHSSLEILDVNTNFLLMELPSTIGNTLPRLSGLGLRYNMFQGQIPASLGNASYLSVILLTSNNFTGQVPSSLGNLSLLQYLNLDGNKLETSDSKSWEFLDALGKCRVLKSLTLADNQLQGAIPNSIGKLSPGLQYLGLGQNKLTGMIPESIGNLKGLNSLYLGQNNLAGPIGSWVGNLKNLGILNLTDNNFSGPIPSSLGSLTGLTWLYLQNNKFDGPVPASLENLQQLLVLNLSCNNLQGPIPKELFSPISTITTCILSYNNLEGPIPPEVRNLQQLNELDLSSNKLTGEIPVTLGECRQLEILKMGYNFLTGNISLLSTLKSLSMLNLSHNNLSGSIPIELGNMSYLTQLDLSYNDLRGEVPRDGVFRNASAVSLVGNSGLCGWTLDSHMRSCPTASRRKMAQYYLIRVLIPVFGFMSLLMLIYFVLTEKRMARAPSLSPLGDQFPIVSYNDLAQATKNFSESNLIGRGSCGSVYRGNLTKNKLEVAVKILDLDMRGAEKSFLSECQALRNIRHRNLVPIITACSTVDANGNVFKALVYEFMPNGNLDSWLHLKGNGKARKPLSLNQRTCLAVNIADVLDYLHHESGSTIIHCDVKPNNILLDDDMNARLGDFGIAKLYLDSRSQSTGDSNTTSSIGVKGTIGYIAPGMSFVTC
jgi:Leucine-rich repeat (LRR) protein